MHLLEIIILRLAEADRNDIDLLLVDLSKEIEKQSHQVKGNFYCNAFLNTDICIQLRSEVPSSAINASQLGMRLADSLKPFGLVDHTCWIEWE